MARKKGSKTSEFRTLPGAGAISNLMKEIANVQTNLDNWNKQCVEYAEWKKIPLSDAQALFKKPEGMSDTMKLRSFIRLAMIRSEIAMDVTALTAIAATVARYLPEGDVKIRREKLQTANGSDTAVSA